jgi:hypothetical protein
MNHNAFPVIRIELEGMKQAIAHAFTHQQLELTGAVDHALQRTIDAFDFEGEVRGAAAKYLKEQVDSSVRVAISQLFYRGGVAAELESLVRAAILKGLAITETDPAK